MGRSVMTRALHALLAMAVIYQLASSLYMEGPRHGREAGGLPGLLFNVHEWVGLASLGVVLMFWLWALLRRGETGLGALIPWFSRSRRAALKTDLLRHLQAFGEFKIPDHRAHAPLPDAIHGLGLLLVSAMAATGTFFYVGHDDTGLVKTLANEAKELHETLANVVWAYLIGHAGMALLHSATDHDIIQAMFGLRHKGEVSEALPKGDPSRSAS